MNPPNPSCVVPYLIVRDAEAAIDFYHRAFSATETFGIEGPHNQIVHAELCIGSAVFMLTEEDSKAGYSSPLSLLGSSVSLLIYVDDVDVFIARALGAGATLVNDIEDQFYGDRSGTIKDPFGHLWTIATQKEELTPDEIHERAKAFFSSQKQ